jgi:L-ribulose-5-phosphate 4-epimerase
MSTAAFDQTTPATDPRHLVALSSRILGQADQGDFIWGHSSMRDPDGRGLWIKASGWGVEEITPERVHLVSFEGELLKGAGVPHLELHIHAEIMRARPDIGAVVHTHSPYAIALAAAGEALIPVSHAACFFAGETIPRFTETSDLINTAERGRSLAKLLDRSSATLLVNHGIVTTGPDIQTATVAALILEQAAYHQALVRGFGATHPHVTTEEETHPKRSNIYNPRAVQAVWDYLVRGLPEVGATARGTTGSEIGDRATLTGSPASA